VLAPKLRQAEASDSEDFLLHKLLNHLMSMLLIGSSIGSLDAQTADLSKQYDRWDALLAANVQADGGVDYRGFLKAKAELTSWLSDQAKIDVKALSSDERKAFFINFYNAGMIFNVLRYAEENKIDLESPAFLQLKINDLRVVGGNLWNGSFTFELGSWKVSLDDIEHKLIRGQDPGELKEWTVGALDPRIHAAVNCAAISCPRVREMAFRGSNVDKMLEENMREFLSAPGQFSLIDAKKLKANSILLWYYADFDDYGKSVKLRGAGDYLASFLEAASAAAIVKHFKDSFNDRSKLALRMSSDFDFHYDWRVNDVRNRL
jgi:hypothetical protein